ncbi:MAG: hypothetical protein BWY06_03072 [Candidatus Latescibacteria bacterium ADurb.Bin168]|nr:MAG: hypothetical protein BWY06_03072 [Candidatus Latescibacteria bacterium ADurb.Bin168]
MRKDYVRDAFARQIAHQFGGLLIVQVPLRAAYTLFDIPRISAPPQSFCVVVRFYDCKVHRSHLLSNEGSNRAQVGCDPDGHEAVTNNKLNRIRHVVRNGKRFHLKPVDDGP